MKWAKLKIRVTTAHCLGGEGNDVEVGDILEAPGRITIADALRKVKLEYAEIVEGVPVPDPVQHRDPIPTNRDPNADGSGQLFPPNTPGGGTNNGEGSGGEAKGAENPDGEGSPKPGAGGDGAGAENPGGEGLPEPSVGGDGTGAENPDGEGNPDQNAGDTADSDSGSDTQKNEHTEAGSVDGASAADPAKESKAAGKGGKKKR